MLWAMPCVKLHAQIIKIVKTMPNACRLPAIRHNDGLKPSNLLRLSEEANDKRSERHGPDLPYNHANAFESEFMKMCGNLKWRLCKNLLRTRNLHSTQSHKLTA